MKERPILMTPENAQKCHEGTKTQTRRIVKPQPLRMSWFEHQQGWCARVREDMGSAEHPAYVMVPCPYGVVGDRLWVREALCRNGSVMTYRDGSLVMQGDLVMPSWCERKTIPSIHMPRWACRTVLEITDIRVERLKEISEEDALAEIGSHETVTQEWVDDCEPGTQVHELATLLVGKQIRARLSFMNLWIAINGRGSWALNPWVWVIEFRKVPEIPSSMSRSLVMAPLKLR